MNIELARKFLLVFLPPEGQGPMSDLFNLMKTDPLRVFNDSVILTQIEHFHSQDRMRALACAQGVLCGFSLAFTMGNPMVAQRLVEIIEDHQKSLGENVVSFLERKVK